MQILHSATRAALCIRVYAIIDHMRRYSASSLAYDGHSSIVNGVNIASQQDVNEFALELILELLDLLSCN